MKIDLNSLARKFIMNEGVGPKINSWIQALSEDINSLKPRSLSEERRIEVMKHNLLELRRSTRRMQLEVKRLEEQVTVLQEQKNGKED
jgi:hypothetical protein|tara:strand:- start:1647 stop:1910 length:264 start_codon:yes stop_codon:yes gene_type:complete